MSRRAFRNASQASQTLAPQGVLSKLGETINSRLRNATSFAGAATPQTVEGSGGVPVNAAGDGVQDVPIDARALSTKNLTNLVGGIREGARRRTTAIAASLPSSSSPPLSERAVKGVLGTIFTNKETIKEGGGGEGGYGGGVQASAPERAGSTDHGEGIMAPSQGNRGSSGLLGRFRRPSQDAERTKSPPPLITPGPEPRHGSNGRGGGETSRARRGVSAKKVVNSSSKKGVPAARATAVKAARNSTPAVASTAAPSARPKVDQPPRSTAAPVSATDESGKPTEQGSNTLRAKEKVGPESNRRRRSQDGTGGEQRHWRHVDVSAGPTTRDGSLVDKIRAPWASLKVGGHGPRGEQRSGRKVKTDVVADGGGGKAVVVRMRGLFGGRHGKRESGSESIGNVSDSLDEIGLGG